MDTFVTENEAAAICWSETDTSSLEIVIAALRARNEQLEQAVQNLHNKLETLSPTPIDDTYGFGQFITRIAQVMGRTYGWRIDYVQATWETPGCTAVTIDEIAAWQRAKRVPAWAYEQIERLNFAPRTCHKAQLWTDEEMRFLIEAYYADPTASNIALAKACSRKFKRSFNDNAIKGALFRLGRAGHIPLVRPKRKGKSVT